TCQDVPRHPGDDRGLASAALLVAVLEPVPAALGVRLRRLLGVEHETAWVTRGLVHARARREIVGALCAAVQHDDERERLPFGARRNVEFVIAGRRAGAEPACHESLLPNTCTHGLLLFGTRAHVNGRL